MREWTPIRTIPYHLPWVLGIAVVMAVTGPFGTYETMGLGKRLLYFTITGVLAWALVIGTGLPLPIYARNIWMIYRDRERVAA